MNNQLDTPQASDAFSQFAVFLHLNIWDWMAIIISCLSLIVAIFTLRSQNETKKNTAIVEPKDLRNKLLSYYLYLIRANINIRSLHIKLDENDWQAYPSEEYLWNMKLPEVDENKILLKLVYGRKSTYKVQGLNELIRFYNYSIDAAVIHLKDSRLDKATRLRDIINLKNKSYLIWYQILDLLICFDLLDKGDKYKSVRDKFYYTVKEYYDRIQAQELPSGYEQYFQDLKNHAFINEIFQNREDLKEEFLKNMEAVIIFHLSKRSDGYDRVPLIKF